MDIDYLYTQTSKSVTKRLIAILYCIFLIAPSLMKGQEMDIYLHSVINTKDRGKIQIFYDEQRRIMSIHSFASWNSLSDSTSITIYYDKKGHIRQKYQFVTKIDNDSMKPLLSTGSTYDYTYKKKGIIDVYVFKSTKFYGTDMYELDANHAQIYTDRDKNIVEEWFDSKKEKISLFKSKFNKDGTLSAYYQSSRFRTDI